MRVDVRVRAWAWWVVAAAVAGARELDPAACAARFDVQRDKIIRTEESRDMGARYLSELDVGARHECLRLCCETDACDVFVYEEKGPGSCYLFKCGPPEDFRCKFTAHSNFSSGVLALSRRLAELQDQEQRAHREHELASLRSATSTARTTTATPPPPPPSPPPRPMDPHPAPRGCSRYQFECRRGGECIAVYNACDGVPQCADGSDEAPELGCPPAAPPAPPAPPALPPPTPAPTQTTLPPAAPVPLLTPLQDSVELGMGGEGPAFVPALGPPESPADRWPHRLTQAQPQHRYTEMGGSSHIFSHKGGLVQEAEAEVQPAVASWPRRVWPQHPPGMDGMSGWLGGAAWPEADPRRGWPVPPPRPDPEMSMYIPKTMPEIPMVYSSQQQTLRDSAKKGFELSPRVEPTAPPPPRQPPPALAAAPRREESKPAEIENTTKKKVVKEKSSESSKPLRESHVVESDEVEVVEVHAGLSERPPAAVLLLVLGILMTGVMGGMLGCRARAARRRLRRGKSPLAHDADYLVNGMYL